MDKLRFIVWYGDHLDFVFVFHLIPGVLSWYFYFQPIGRQELTWAVFALMLAIYYWTKKRFRKYCQNLIIKKSGTFKEFPQISGATSEHLIDSFDKEILNTLDELREEKDDYLKVLPALSDIMTEKEIIYRLAKLRSLGLIRVQPSRVTLTPSGAEVMSTPAVATKAIIPARFASILARVRIMFDEGNFNGAMDMVNILFEDILRATIEERLGEKLDSTWKELLKKGHVNRPFNRASLGVLLAACRHIGIISQGSIPDILLGIFLKLRVPQKHLTEIKVDPERDARSSLDLAQIFIRYWFVR